MRIKIKNARIVNLKRFPGDEQVTQTVELAAVLTPPIAEKLRCRDGCYDENGVPRNFRKWPSPNIQIKSADVSLGELSAHANLVHCFNITQPGTGNDTTLELKFTAHFDQNVRLADWQDSINKDEFLVAINARQEDLDFGDEPQEEEEEEVDNGCVLCANGVEFAEGSDTKHANGKRCTRAELQQTIASISAMKD
jgi:hypothetical protein